MGLYTELVVACYLVEDLPQEVIQAIKWWIGDIEDDPEWANPTPDTKLPPWCFDVLNTSEPTFPGSLQLEFRMGSRYHLTIRSSRKNYEHAYEYFLSWIAKYSDYDCFVGYIWHELEETPRLIYFKEGKAFLGTVRSQDLEEINVRSPGGS